jgi:PAS domain S-box-containing protein
LKVALVKRGAPAIGRSSRLAALVATAIAAGTCAPSVMAEPQVERPLWSPEEKAWLQAHPQIRLAPDPDFPPMEFFDETGTYRGLAADYVRLIEKRLGIELQILRLQNWSECLSRAKSREIDVLPAATKTPQREEYMAFTSPHIRMPGVIMTARETLRAESLSDLYGLKVVVVKDYVWQDLISNDHPQINLITAEDSRLALRTLAFGGADAMISDPATATYFMQQEGLTNLRIVGESGYEMALAFAVRKDWPQLRGILEKAVASISAEERARIHDRWFQLDRAGSQAKPEFSRVFVVSLAITLALLIGLVVWNRVLRQRLVQLQEISILGGLDANAEPPRDRRKILLYSIATMTLITVAVASTVNYVLYSAAFDQRRQSLMDLVTAQARLIDAVARFDRVHSQDAHAGGAAAATIGQVVDSHRHSHGLGETGEFLMARLDGDEMVFLLDWRHDGPNARRRIPFKDSTLSEPMRRALKRQSGTLVGPDYRDQTVLAAYEHVGELDLGIVAKMDLEEIRSPFVTASLVAGVGGSLLILLGSLVMVWINNPLIKRVEERESQFRTLVQNIPGLTYRCLMDEEWTLIYLSDAILELTGYSPSDFLTGRMRYAQELIHPNDRQRASDLRHKAVSAHRSFTLEYRIQHRDGRTLWVQDTGRAIYGDEDGIDWIDGTVFDVTERKQAENQLRLQSAALEAAANAIVITESDGAIIWVNNAFERLTGFSSAEAVGQNPRILKSGQHDEELYRDLWSTIRAGNVWQGELVNRRKDGTLYSEEMTITPVLEANGDVTRFVSIKQDITARKQAEVQLERARESADRANEAKSQFLANMSHELRTPMNAIIGYSEMLEEEAEEAGAEDFIPDLQKIHSAGRHLLGLINDILDLSKIESGKLELHPETFEISRMVQDVATTVDPLIRKNNNTLTVEFDDNIGAVCTDVTRVRQVLLNLLSNSAKFTENGVITLSTGREALGGSDWLVFQVADEGIGMTEEQLERVFEPFAQADSSTTRKYGGTGLGLAICKRFCEMMGGDISAQSELGAGSTFTVRIRCASETPPDSAPEPAAAETSEAALSEGGGENTVLIIDDDRAARELTVRLLSREGFEVATAASGEEGVELARRTNPSAILLDVMMPSMDGWSVLSVLKSDPDLSDIPVFMATMVENRELGLALGASEYLVKPVDRDCLLNALRRHQRSRAPGSVLLIDDDKDAREVIARTFRRDGWRVEEADNGESALARLNIHTPDVIFLDLMMPEMDGFAFLERVRQEDAWSAIPIVVLTAKELTADDRRRLHRGIERVLQKGSNSLDDLLSELRRQASKSGQQSGIER